MKSAIVVAKSGNAKTGKVAATYAPQSTCPTVCPLRGSGCYAESGNIRYTLARLDHTADSLAVAMAEAEGIDNLKGDIPLRVHVVGDCSDNASANIVGSAMRRYEQKGSFAWTYTHAWRDVPHSEWDGANVLASLENPADIPLARSQGYSPAIVVQAHESDKAYYVDGQKVIPCPEQTKGITCADCGLCARFGKSADSPAIAFAIHGARKGAASLAIQGKGI